MPSRLYPFVMDHYYHIYNRGVNRTTIFFSDRNYEFFIFKMSRYLLNTAEIVAYCLMPNHFHLLIRIKSESGFERAISSFLISYVKSVNIDQDRVGPLFQGRFQSKAIEDDDYLLGLTCYIHLNPVMAGLVKTPEDWKFSSYREYVGLRSDGWIKKSVVIDQFGNPTGYGEYVRYELNNKKTRNFRFEE